MNELLDEAYKTHPFEQKFVASKALHELFAVPKTWSASQIGLPPSVL